MSDRRREQPNQQGRGLARAYADPGPSREPRYAINVVAARTGVHITTIRRYEEFGVVESIIVQSGVRMYSDDDIDRIQRARRLIDDLGVNLAGAAAILQLREQLIALQQEFQTLQDRAGGR